MATPMQDPPEADERADEPACCKGQCCGPGSYCCQHAGPHSHDDKSASASGEDVTAAEPHPAATPAEREMVRITNEWRARGCEIRAASAALVALGQADDRRSLAERIGDAHAEVMRHLHVARAERDTALAEVPARLKAEREAAALYGALDSASKDGARAVAAAHARGRREAIEEAARYLEEVGGHKGDGTIIAAAGWITEHEAELARGAK